MIYISYYYIISGNLTRSTLQDKTVHLFDIANQYFILNIMFVYLGLMAHQHDHDTLVEKV